MLFLMLLAAGPAMGASIALTGSTLSYTTDGEEENNVSVTQGADGSLTVTSTGTALLNDGDGAGGCVVAGNMATCPPASSITAEVGDLNDIFKLDPSVTVPAELFGGAGVDTLTGGSGNDTLHLRLGGGGDSATCGAGVDTVDLDLDDAASVDCENQDTPPQTSITGGPSGVIGSATGLAFTFNSDPDASVQCHLRGPVKLDRAPCSSPVDLPEPPATSLPDGDYAFEITSTDAFGSGTPARQTFTVDATAPEVIVTRLAPTNAATAHFQLDAIDTTAVTFECSIGTGAPAPCADIFSTPALPNGSYTLSVKGTDLAGHSTTTAFPFTIQVAAGNPPAVQPRRIIIESLVLISGRPVKMSRRGVVKISLQCAGTKKCTGRMTITTAEPINRKRRKLERLGSTRFSIAANKKRTVRVRFSKSKRKLARRLKRFKAKVVITEVDQRGNKRISSRVFVLRAR
jgi:hypothetical protein